MKTLVTAVALATLIAAPAFAERRTPGNGRTPTRPRLSTTVANTAPGTPADGSWTEAIGHDPDP